VWVSASAPDVPVYVVLLRGINLGSKRRVAMADLRSLLEGLGYDDVRTHLQSGNAVLRTPTRSAATVEKAVERAIVSELGLEVKVAARTAAQLAAVVDADPFAGVATVPARYLVTFLEKKPPASWLDSVDSESYAPEQAAVVGKQLYLWLPDGVQNSRLARNLTDKKLGGSATSRNWNVVRKLAELAAQ
jgi:uncharacterized protein (DUF1697 family)